jgi:hypothetical protein
VFTARYTLSPYIKQIRFVFKRLTYHLRLRLQGLREKARTVISAKVENWTGHFRNTSQKFYRCTHRIEHTLAKDTSRVSYAQNVFIYLQRTNCVFSSNICLISISTQTAIYSAQCFVYLSNCHRRPVTCPPLTPPLPPPWHSSWHGP